ncbi:hypothetical protein N44_02501 [Microcystis aeruginosa NIES-44]|uniref:Uncharacterized protein n=1 Tax=Microcystis aeruginosa NIES-44 TaxID=449439 RepID=A0A0A1VXE6_MICAE|nr:hypothetical protein N44_02501 [Microcystis aeruginosa NIES-44]
MRGARIVNLGFLSEIKYLSKINYTYLPPLASCLLPFAFLH